MIMNKAAWKFLRIYVNSYIHEYLSKRITAEVAKYVIQYNILSSLAHIRLIMPADIHMQSHINVNH